MAWYRTCQECGCVHSGPWKEPQGEMTNSYRNAKCKGCGSEALDYGSGRDPRQPEDYTE